MLRKSLFSEIFYSIIVCIGHKILDAHILGMSLQPIHQPCTISLHLLRSRNCEEDNLSKSLGRKWPENTASQDCRLARLCTCRSICRCITSSNNHSLMLAIHSEPHNIIPRHSWQLFGNNVFQINQIPHRSERSIENKYLIMICENTYLSFLTTINSIFP